MRIAALLALALTFLAAGSTGAEQDEVVLGKPSAIQPVETEQETARLDAGTRIRQTPRLDAPILEVLDTALKLPILDRQGEWLKVRFGTRLGWVHPEGDRGLDRQGPLLSFAPDEERLWRARSALGAEVEPRVLGPFTLYSDIQDEALLGWLSAIAQDSLRAYRERFHLDPGTPVEEVVILFAEEADYRDFEAAEERIAGTDSRGYTSEGLSILFQGDHDRASLASVFVHELTHLLNRRVFRSTLPPWLEEGMAEDLAFSQVTRDGSLRLGTIAGESPRGLEDETSLSGPKAQLAVLVTAWEGAGHPDLETLWTLEWDEFIQPGNRALHYTASAMFLRYLTDGGNADLRRAFFDLLEEAAAAELVPAISTWTSLGLTPAQATDDVYKFVLRQARANGIR